MAISSSAQTLTTLVTFNVTDGAQPDYGGLTQGRNGNFYGTTISGGANDSGTLFEVTPAGDMTVLHNFCSEADCEDGDQPDSTPLLGTDGNFYGTTQAGGTTRGGTAFEITPAGEFTTLYQFCTAGTFCLDGSGPNALTQGTDGSLYGTAQSGGGPDLAGTIFRLTPEGKLTTLYVFCSKVASGVCLDGASPNTTLVQDKSGNFYGTTILGGTTNHGTIFEMTAAGQFKTIYSFCTRDSECSDGFAASSLVAGPRASLYGTAQGGGSANAGIIFEIANGKLTTLYNFGTRPHDGLFPTGLTIGNGGKIYGTTIWGGTQTGCVHETCGTIFEMTASGSTVTLYDFCSQAGCADGFFPTAGVVQGSDGNLYGITVGGGNGSCHGGCGTVFRLNLQ